MKVNLTLDEIRVIDIALAATRPLLEMCSSRKDSRGKTCRELLEATTTLQKKVAPYLGGVE